MSGARCCWVRIERSATIIDMCTASFGTGDSGVVPEVACLLEDELVHAATKAAQMQTSRTDRTKRSTAEPPGSGPHLPRLVTCMQYAKPDVLRAQSGGGQLPVSKHSAIVRPSSTLHASQPLTSMPPLTYAAAGFRYWNLRPSSRTRNGGSTTARLPWYSTPMPAGTSLRARPLNVLVLTPRWLGEVDLAVRARGTRGVGGAGAGRGATTGAGAAARPAAIRMSSARRGGMFGRSQTRSATEERSISSTSRKSRVKRAVAHRGRVGSRRSIASSTTLAICRSTESVVP